MTAVYSIHHFLPHISRESFDLCSALSVYSSESLQRIYARSINMIETLDEPFRRWYVHNLFLAAFYECFVYERVVTRRRACLEEISPVIRKASTFKLCHLNLQSKIRVNPNQVCLKKSVEIVIIQTLEIGIRLSFNKQRSIVVAED